MTLRDKLSQDWVYLIAPAAGIVTFLVFYLGLTQGPRFSGPDGIILLISSFIFLPGVLLLGLVSLILVTIIERSFRTLIYSLLVLLLALILTILPEKGSFVLLPLIPAQTVWLVCRLITTLCIPSPNVGCQTGRSRPILGTRALTLILVIIALGALFAYPFSDFSRSRKNLSLANRSARSPSNFPGAVISPHPARRVSPGVGSSTKPVAASRVAWTECVNNFQRSCAEVCSARNLKDGLCERPRFGIRTAYIRFHSEKACALEHWLESEVKEGKAFEREEADSGIRTKCCCENIPDAH